MSAGNTERDRTRGYGHRAEFTIPGAEEHYPPDLELEPVHLDIDLRVDVKDRTVEGVVTHTFRSNRATVRTAVLDGVDLDGVRVESPDGEALVWGYDGRKIRITWDQPVPRGQTRRAAVHYRADEPASGLFFSGPTKALPNAPLYAATDHETERARHWLPCVDLPSARPTLAFHLRAESGLTILANGTLDREETHDDGTKTAHWTLDAPCPSYLTCFCIGDLVRADDGDHQGIPIAYFATREFDEGHLRRSFGRTGAMMAWLTERLDQPFPYPKYYQFALPGFGGAMENISLVSWDDVFVLDEPLSQEWGRLVDLINVHEMAHSYFGDLVVCRDFAHAWLKEAWATYIEMCWLEHAHGRDEQLYELFVGAETYFDEVETEYARPLVVRRFNTSWDLYDMHLYPGGACRLHTLRCLLGDDVFWPAVQDYVARYAGKTVETDDFRRVMEEHSGKSLGRFFDQWFRSPGHPKLKVSFEFDAEAKRGSFEIEQAQVVADKPAPEGPPCFEFELDLEWGTGEETRRETVSIDRPRQRFAFPMEADPDRVRIDPEFKVLHRLEFEPGTPRLETQLTGAKDVVGRIQAGRALVESGKRSSLRKVLDAWSGEPFWGVRLEWGKAMAKAGSVAARDAWIEALESEEDPQVLGPLLRAASVFRDAQVAQAVLARLDKGLPPRAKQAALEVLGAQRDAAPLDRLVAAADADGFGGFAGAGAVRALGATRKPEALEALLARTGAGAIAERVRPTVPRALGGMARRLDRRPRERVVDRLVDLLRDPSARVRDAAADGLEAAGATEAIEALEDYRRPLAAQDQVGVTRIIQTLSKGEGPRTAALQDQVEKLRDKVRKLEDRLEKLEANATAAQAADDSDGSPDSDDASDP